MIYDDVVQLMSKMSLFHKAYHSQLSNSMKCKSVSRPSKGKINILYKNIEKRLYIFNYYLTDHPRKKLQEQ